MSDPRRTREIHLASRPVGWPTPDDFALVRTELPAPAEGHVVVRNQFLSVDPYMRRRMNDVKSYVPPFVLGAVMEGGAVGVVTASRSPALAVGATVLHNLGWREHAIAEASAFRQIDTTLAPPTAYLSTLGMPGLTAYTGLLEIAGMQAGDVVFVSAAAGAVGGLAGQIARLRGAARVIGSAGSARKVAHLRDELGFDAAFDYNDGPVRGQLAAAAPDGIDVYFDNVGGEHLEAAIWNMRRDGRIALCGAISQYNEADLPPGPRNLFELIGRRISMRGYLVGDHRHRMREFVAEMSGWLRVGGVCQRETVVEGLERMPETFIAMLRGENVGKMLVRIPGS
jgi:NADPH-dependent curcumin reductase CurA